MRSSPVTRATTEGPRTATATFFIKRLLPEHAALLAHAGQGAENLYALGVDDLAAS